jgi:hypothetical protein
MVLPAWRVLAPIHRIYGEYLPIQRQVGLQLPLHLKELVGHLHCYEMHLPANFHPFRSPDPGVF